ncbi:hypothetical protein ACFVRB_33310 [Streptomyces nojiriensis]|uniref:hypothetical protein n=1 Tax=Streptomyces nojiriensis TaxID=66374 RepID=UPI0036DD7A55
MARREVGALPMWGTDHKLKAMLTDRDVDVAIFAVQPETREETPWPSTLGSGTPLLPPR